MFSGGLLSRNLGRSFAKKGSKNQESKKPSKKLSNRRRSTGSTLRNEDLINWREETDRRRKNNANLRPTYVFEVEGKVRLLSPAGFFGLLGIGILVFGSLLVSVRDDLLIGPVGIGIGLYVILMAVCWLLDSRNNSKKIFHIQDIYIKHAVKYFNDNAKVFNNPDTFDIADMEANPVNKTSEEIIAPYNKEDQLISNRQSVIIRKSLDESDADDHQDNVENTTKQRYSPSIQELEASPSLFPDKSSNTNLPHTLESEQINCC